MVVDNRIIKRMTNLNSEISIQELITNFRESLLATGKLLERVGIDLADNYSGDAWDDISEAFFYHLVIDPIRTGLQISQNDFLMPQYEVGNFNYSKGSYLSCSSVRLDKDANYAFFGFLRRASHFDKVRCYVLDQKFQFTGEKIFMWDDLSFCFNLLSKDGTRKNISSIILRS